MCDKQMCEKSLASHGCFSVACPCSMVHTCTYILLPCAHAMQVGDDAARRLAAAAFGLGSCAAVVPVPHAALLALEEGAWRLHQFMSGADDVALNP